MDGIPDSISLTFMQIVYKLLCECEGDTDRSRRFSSEILKSFLEEQIAKLTHDKTNYYKVVIMLKII